MITHGDMVAMVVGILAGIASAAYIVWAALDRKLNYIIEILASDGGILGDDKLEAGRDSQGLRRPREER